MYKLLENARVKAYIDKRLKKIESEKIATAEEIFIYWTDVMRGNSESEVIVMVGEGEGISTPQKIIKKPDEKEKLTASKELAKRLIDNRSEESKEDKLDRLLDSIEGVFDG